MKPLVEDLKKFFRIPVPAFFYDLIDIYLGVPQHFYRHIQPPFLDKAFTAPSGPEY